MIIRQAKESDIPEVKRLIDTFQVARSQQGWEKQREGLFEYPKSEEELLKSLNPYFIVAETRLGVRGFSLAYAFNFLKEKFNDRQDNPDLSIKHILETECPRTLYWDQIAVQRPRIEHRQSIPDALVDCTLKNAKKRGLTRAVGYVCHEPWFNRTSAHYIKGKGFKKRGLLAVEDGIKLGIYVLKL